MTKFIVRRVLITIPVLIGISFLVYMIMLAAPGGPTQAFEEHPGVSEGMLAFYPWRSVVSMTVGEPDTLDTRDRTGLLWKVGRGKQQSTRDGSVTFRLGEEE